MRIDELFSDSLVEDVKYEFKTILNKEDTFKWGKSLVALANGEGGIIYVGVSDDRIAFGLPYKEIDATKNLVYLEIDRHIFPHIDVSFEMRSVDADANNFVLAIKVKKSTSIVSYRHGDFNEVVYVKGDGNSVPARPSDIISLGGKKHGVDNSVSNIMYDENEWSSYISLCQEFRKAQDYPSVKELINNEIVNEEGYVTTGLLMFKDDYHGDDTRIHCRLFRGLSKDDEVIDRAEFKGSIADCLINSLKFVKRNTKKGYRKLSNGGREDIFSYPEVAIREALVNAVAHRDYSIYGSQIDVNIFINRIEITSPGSWLLPKSYYEYEVDDIPSIRRNQIICACLDLANLMERGGTGFKTINGLYSGYGDNKQPTVSSYDGFFIIRLYDLLYREEIIKEPTIEFELNQIKQAVIDALRKGPKTVKELQSLSTYKSRDKFLSKVIRPLIKDGIIEREGNPKSKVSYFVICSEGK